MSDSLPGLSSEAAPPAASFTYTAPACGTTTAEPPPMPPPVTPITGHHGDVPGMLHDAAFDAAFAPVIAAIEARRLEDRARYEQLRQEQGALLSTLYEGSHRQ